MDKRMAFKALSRGKKTGPRVPWWSKLVQEHPIATAGTVISIVGGLILLGFFCQLGGGMPELDLAGASAILMAVAIVGLGLGEIPVRMVVTRAGCDYLNKAAGNQVVCRIEAGDSTAIVCPAMLRSRIGSPFFIGLSAYEEDGRWPQLHPPKRLEAIAIPKADVPSWSQLARAAAKAPQSAASGTIVTYLAAEDRGAWLRAQCGEDKSAAPRPQPTASGSRPD